MDVSVSALLFLEDVLQHSEEIPRGLLDLAVNPATDPVLRATLCTALLVHHCPELDDQTVDLLFGGLSTGPRSGGGSAWLDGWAQVIDRRVRAGQPPQVVLRDVFTVPYIVDNNSDLARPMGQVFMNLNGLPSAPVVRDAVLATGGHAELLAAARAGWDYRGVLGRLAQLWTGDLATAVTIATAFRVYGDDPDTQPRVRGRFVPRDLSFLWEEITSVTLLFAVGEYLPLAYQRAGVRHTVELWLADPEAGPPVPDWVRTAVSLKNSLRYWSDATLLQFLQRAQRFNDSSWGASMDAVEEELAYRRLRTDPVAVATGPIHTVLAQELSDVVVPWLVEHVPDNASAWEVLIGLFPADTSHSAVSLSDVVTATTEVVSPARA